MRLIQDAVGSMTNETVGGIRVQSMNADRAISRLARGWDVAAGGTGGGAARRANRSTRGPTTEAAPDPRTGRERVRAPGGPGDAGSTRRHRLPFLADPIDLLVIVAAVIGFYFAVSGVRFLLHPRRFSWPEASTLSPQHAGMDPADRLPAIGWANTG